MNKIEPTQKFLYINIHDYLDTKDETIIGELNDMFSDFSCPKNKDVENFLKKSAIRKKLLSRCIPENHRHRVTEFGY